jgi:hypothetical protein
VRIILTLSANVGTEELQFRRECVLDTISSVAKHFLAIYLSRERQCKLGYDSSLQCDAYQLGEMLRFFARSNIVDLQSTIYNIDTAVQIYSGDIYHLISTLRQCPAYQIDGNHSHCGLRARMIPLLDEIEKALADVGICAECWEHSREEYAWSRAKRLPIWRRGASRDNRHRSVIKRPTSNCIAAHGYVQDMFTAVERDWTARDSDAENLHRDNLSSGMKLR